VLVLSGQLAFCKSVHERCKWKRYSNQGGFIKPVSGTEPKLVF
jgi:hypothetical protein